MQIEFFEKVTLVHIKPGDASQTQCEVLQRQLIELMKVPCIFVPNGEPTKSSMVVRAFRKSNKALLEAIRKISRNPAGAYVPLDDDEFAAIARAKADGELVEV